MADVENQGGDSQPQNEPNAPWWLKWGAKILGKGIITDFVGISSIILLKMFILNLIFSFNLYNWSFGYVKAVCFCTEGHIAIFSMS